jgi:hypothetical protein
MVKAQKGKFSGPTKSVEKGTGETATRFALLLPHHSSELTPRDSSSLAVFVALLPAFVVSFSSLLLSARLFGGMLVLPVSSPARSSSSFVYFYTLTTRVPYIGYFCLSYTLLSHLVYILPVLHAIKP